MEYKTIRYDVADGIATITLARPASLNAYNVDMVQDLLAAFDAIDGDDSVRAAIVTGEGRAFCAGADLSPDSKTFEFGRKGEGVPRNSDGSFRYEDAIVRDGGGLLTLRIYKCLKPVIAAINGPAVGIGVTMTLAMDYRLASASARFGFVFSKRATVPEAASAWFLPRLVGMPKALDWCYSGRIFPAAEALEAGLVQQLCPDEDLLASARELALTYATGTAPVSVALIRQMLWRGLGAAHPMEVHRVDSRGILSRLVSRDGAEGIASFFEKRPPQFPDTVSQDMPDYFPWWTEPAYE